MTQRSGVHRAGSKRAACLGPLAYVALLLLLSIAASHARADVPPLLPIQGYLTDKGGAAIQGAKMVAFRLYAAPTGGTPLHEEALQVVAVDGYFTAYLGDDSLHPLDLAQLRDNAKVFLGIEIEKDGEGVPRLQLASTAFAAQAAFCGDANTVAGRAPNTFADASHTHDWAGVTGKPTEFAPAAHAHDWAAVTGKPTEFAPEPHAHGDADIACYDDLGAEGYLDNNDVNDVLLRGQGDALYAGKIHGHNASDIGSGTLSDLRFSAYADLVAENYLNNDAPTDLISQGQADMRFVNTGESNSVTSAMITDGAIVAADLQGGSVTMDKTTGPLGSITTAQVIASAGSTTNMLVSPVIPTDSSGSCVVTATVRSVGGAAPTGIFYAYPIVQANGGGIGAIGGTTIGYGMATTSTSNYQTNTISGVIGTSAGASYQFGCGVVISASSTFAGNTFVCVSTWICN